MLTIHDGDGDTAMDDMKSKKKKAQKNVSAVRSALECAYSILQSRIISSPNDMMGILLFGTEKTRFKGENDSAGGFAHCYLLMDLDVPDVDGIKELKMLLEDEDQWNDLLVPSEGSISMANVLFGANQIFTTRAPNFSSRKLFIITDDDDPHSDDKALKQSSITRASDLYDLGVQIDPFFISYPGKKAFDPTNFYEDIIYRSQYDDEDTPIATSGTARLQEMVTTIRSKAVPKRTQFSTKLEIGPGLTIGVKGYLMYKKQEKGRSHYIYTGGEKVQIVEGTTTNMAEFTAKVVEKSEIKKAYKFGGEQVVFTDDEMKAMRNFGDPCIRIIGFKRRDSIHFDHNVKPAQFIYPDEKDFVGSTRTFTALHRKLVASAKVGLCWCILRRNTSPSLCALWPSTEETAGGVQTRPAGFFLITLPFADDVRATPEVSPACAPAPLIDAMRSVVKQLHMPAYTPDKYENPSLQWHYRILQAMALDEDVPTVPVDRTLPKFKLIQKYAAAVVEEWAAELERHAGPLRTAAVKSAAGKRVKDEDGDAAPPKKVSRAVTPMGSGEVKAAYGKGQLHKMTVVALRDFLKSKGLDTSGKKADLMDRVEQHFESK
ncbi:SPOC like C-terminal domain-containing protein [Geopyxis carbonaria]|nr:SPOC like C-terminal domain-containing protein [Geopyxis carbonaria]